MYYFITFSVKIIAMRKLLPVIIVLSIVSACNQPNKPNKDGNQPISAYFNYGDSGVQMAGIKMIPIKTPVGDFKVWTKRFGNNPRIKVLLLHGGPAAYW
jgi:proline iminopeptidase